MHCTRVTWAAAFQFLPGSRMVRGSIVEENAKEVGHIINQLTLTIEQCKEVSLFLQRSNEDSPTSYNTKLERLRGVLREIPHHEKFLENLHDMVVIDDTKPILLIARYLRKGTKSDVGKPIPAIFERTVSILGGSMHTISSLAVYTIRRPIGYNFPPILHEDGMTFVLKEISNSRNST